MSLETGILGFLSMKPLSGYDLKRLFNMSAAYFWPADQAQIYRTLKKLTDHGLPEGDRRLDSATYACRWGVLRGEAYAKLLEEIKESILQKRNLR